MFHYTVVKEKGYTNAAKRVLTLKDTMGVSDTSSLHCSYFVISHGANLSTRNIGRLLIFKEIKVACTHVNQKSWRPPL
jgi:hypothetical protein